MTSAEAFPRRAGAIFLKLGALYALYALHALDDFPASQTMVVKLALSIASASVVLSLLVPVAVFMAARQHFDPIDEAVAGGRRRQWTWLGLMGFGAYLLSALGPQVSDWALAVVSPPPEGFVMPERPASNRAVRSLVPIAIGLQVVIAAVAGALVGQKTTWAPRWQRHLWTWAAAVTLTVCFFGSVVVIGELADRRSLLFAWALVPGPLVLPLLGTWTLLRSQRIPARDLLRPSGAKSLPVDLDAFERLLSAVRDAATPEELDAGAEADEQEAELGRFLIAVREAAAPAPTTSEKQMQKLVRSTLAAASRTPSRPEPKRSPAWRPRFDWAATGELTVAWGCLASGLAILGLAAGQPPDAVAAAAVGLLGAAVSVWLARRRPASAMLPASA